MAQLEEPFKAEARRGWQQRVRIRNADGTWTRKQKGGFKTKDDARAWRDSMSGASGSQRVSLAELIDRYLAVQTGAESTKKMLRWKLDKALAAFGSIPPAALTREEVERWRQSIPEGHRFETTQALKQTLRWAGTAQPRPETPSRPRRPQPAAVTPRGDAFCRVGGRGGSGGRD